MATSPTSSTLLESLRNPNDATAWERFDGTYRPVLVNFAQQLGLCRDDAEEAAQRTVIAFSKAFQHGNYDSAKGRFKNWLMGIARHEIADLCAERGKQPVAVSQRPDVGGALAGIRGGESLTAIWERQWKERLISICLQRAREHFSSRDVRIFEMLTTEQRSVDEVADTMNVARTTVYTVKHRALAFMVGLKAELESDA